MIRLATSILLWTAAQPSQSMAEICEARALELLAKDADQVRLAPAARRADGSWAITGIYSRMGEGILERL